MEKAGRDDRLTVRDAPQHLLVSLAGSQRAEFELPGARSWKTQEIRRNLESCSQKEAVDGVGIRE